MTTNSNLPANPNGCAICDTGANDRCQHTDEAPRAATPARIVDLMHPPTR